MLTFTDITPGTCYGYDMGSLQKLGNFILRQTSERMPSLSATSEYLSASNLKQMSNINIFKSIVYYANSSVMEGNTQDEHEKAFTVIMSIHGLHTSSHLSSQHHHLKRLRSHMGNEQRKKMILWIRWYGE